MPTKKAIKKSKDYQKVYFLRDFEIFSGIVHCDLNNGTTDVLVMYKNSKPIEHFITNVLNTSLREDKMIYTEEFC